MHDPFIEALIEIHRDLPRKGPGSDALSAAIAEEIFPLLPDDPRIADMGCGNGHTSFLLADLIGGRITAVDFAAPFIEELRRKLDRHPQAGRITPAHGDMGDSGLPAESCDLIWSEGAAFAIGIDTALDVWKSLLTPAGILVFSEACWFTENRSPEAVQFWDQNYPDIQSVADNLHRAERHGYRRLGTYLLPREDWWTSYFDPMAARLDVLERTVAPESLMAEVIAAAYREQEVFRAHGDEYGYAFFVLSRN